MKKVRCAIYTRKSSEEGLEQDFNSLHAQREACTAYILSQASEGWTLLPDEYDDGGLSGGTLERPALQRLMQDIDAGRVDIAVVYKVDRLSRSLLDFAKLVEAFDKTNVSFVSVTQSFNTTNSMGRLTLNMLLSFAQFEREVTAERIRDKIAASKARGMWMGGNPPLGYQPDGRTLAIVEEHACKGKVRYRYYVSRLLQHALDAPHADGLRIPALEIEAAVIQLLAGALDDPLALLAQAGIPLESDRLRMILKLAEQLVASIRGKQRDTIRDLVAKVTVQPHEISVELSVTALGSGPITGTVEV